MNTVLFDLIRIEYALQLLAAEALVSLGFQRRKWFAARAVCACVLTVALYAFTLKLPNFFPYGTLAGALSAGWRYILVLAFTVLCLKLCFKEKVWSLLFCCSAAQATQHLAHRVRDLVFTAAVGGSLKSVPPAVFLIVTVVLFTAVYAVMYVAFFRKLKSRTFPNINKRRITFAAIVCVVLCLWIGVLVTYEDMQNAILFDLAMILLCFFVLAYQFDFLDESFQKMEYENLQRAFSEAKKHYDLTKDNIDIINIKCHDIRKQIRLLGREAKVDEAALKEITDAVSIYDAGINTGNQVLDVIVTDRSIYCDRAGIRFGCMIDGAPLEFISSMDMVSLFGNLIDNAIEAVKNLEDPEKAIINLNVRTQNGMILIHCENYFSSDLTMVDGLPVTTKDDPVFHGYGVKSMRYVAEKYGGTLSFVADGDVFNTNVMIPIP